MKEAYHVIYRFVRNAPAAADYETEFEMKLAGYVKEQVGPGEFWVLSDQDIYDFFGDLSANVQDKGCLFVGSREGLHCLIHSEQVREAFEKEALHRWDVRNSALAAELFDQYVKDPQTFCLRYPQSSERLMSQAA